MGTGGQEDRRTRGQEDTGTRDTGGGDRRRRAHLKRLTFLSDTRMSSTMGNTPHWIRSRTQPGPASSRQCLFCGTEGTRQPRLSPTGALSPLPQPGTTEAVPASRHRPCCGPRDNGLQKTPATPAGPRGHSWHQARGWKTPEKGGARRTPAGLAATGGDVPSEKVAPSRAQWCTPVIPAQGRLKQEECECKAGLSYRERERERKRRERDRERHRETERKREGEKERDRA
jgi:hypothetical protein